MDKVQRYKVASASDLWDPVYVSVHKDTIVESSVKKAVEIGSNFTSMCKYWNQFDGENKYLITPIPDESFD